MFSIASIGVSWPRPVLGGVGRPALGRALCVVLGALIFCAGQGATAVEKITAADRHAIEQTVRSQLDAFDHDDAERAFAFAAPDIQRMFGSSDDFMDMVREQYEPVYHAASVRFLRAEQIDGNWTQPVQVTDAAGHVWRASFTMKRQSDKTWKVAGCQLTETHAIEA